MNPPGERCEELKLCNVVFHFKLNKQEKEKCNLRFSDQAKEDKSYTIAYYHNFYVIKEGKLSFIYFFTSGHVNCTGTKSLKHIKESLKCIVRIFKIKLKDKKLKISNSTWSGRCKYEEVDIISLADGRAAIPYHWTVSLRPSSFPAALIRQREGPSAVLFRNGKYIIVGAIKSKPVRKLSEQLREYVQPLKWAKYENKEGGAPSNCQIDF